MTIRIQVGEHMDCRVHSVFCQASELARYPQTENIEIDLGKTRHIRDSGLGMLLMLYRLSARLKDRIEVVNCQPEIRTRLSDSMLADYVHIT